MAVTATTVLIAFISTPLLLRWLGPERFGAVRAAGDWFGHLTLLELGLGGALPPLLAMALGRGEREHARRLLGAGIRLFGVVALAALAAGVVIALTSARLVPVGASLRQDLMLACAIGLVPPLLYPLVPYAALAEAEQRGYVVQAFTLAQSLVTTALALTLAWAGWGITGQFVALGAGVALFRIGLAGVGASRLPGALAAAAASPDAEVRAAIRRLNLPTFLVNLSGRLGLYTDNIIVALLLGPTQVVPLFLTQRLAGLAGGQLLGLGNASWAALAELHAMGRRDVFVARLLELTRLVAGLAVAVLVPIAAYNHHFVVRWVGQASFGGDAVTLLACVNAYLLALISLWGWCFGGTGQMPLLAPLAVAGAALNIAASIAATRMLGLAGPLVGTLIGIGATSTWYLPILLRRHFGVPLGELVRSALVPLVWGLPAGAALHWLARGHTPAGWTGLLGEMALAAAMLLVFWWSLALSAAERESFAARVRAALRRG